MKSFIAALAAMVGLAVGVSAPAFSSHHHHHHQECIMETVSRAEYDAAEVGMTRNQIASLFDTAGFNAHALGSDNTKVVVDYPFHDGRTVEILYQIKASGAQVLIEKYLS